MSTFFQKTNKQKLQKKHLYYALVTTIRNKNLPEKNIGNADDVSLITVTKITQNISGQ
jgi:hypothetical protein